MKRLRFSRPITHDDIHDWIVLALMTAFCLTALGGLFE